MKNVSKLQQNLFQYVAKMFAEKNGVCEGVWRGNHE